MSKNTIFDIAKRFGAASALALAAVGTTGVAALAQDGAARTDGVDPGENPMAALARLLVAKGALTQAEADALVAQAQAYSDAQVRAAVTAAQANALPPANPGDVDVVYLPEPVRAEIRKEVRDDVIRVAKTENWAQPGQFPDWTRRIALTGDVRLRSENILFDEANTNELFNLRAINSNGFNEAGSDLPQIVNTTEDRTNRLRLRARIGLDADLGDNLSAHLRLATGSDDSPVSTNQTLGGFYDKDEFWLDRAFLRYAAGDHVELFGGRMANPFAQTDLVWDDDVNLDGVAARARVPLGGASINATLGAFPIEYAPENFPDRSTTKLEDGENKWLYAGQIGLQQGWGSDKSNFVRADLAYYVFQDIAGQLSAPCLTSAAFCSTDYTRPGFQQNGNTVFKLRDLRLDPADPTELQFYGYASEFEVLQLGLQGQLALSSSIQARASVQVSQNLGFDEADLIARAGGFDGIITNVAVDTVINTRTDANGNLIPEVVPVAGSDRLVSGDTAWFGRFSLGSPTISGFGDWSAGVEYRYVEPDALVDAFMESDFALGRTNVQGFSLVGALGLTKRSSLNLRWLSANEIDGPELSIDVLHVDLNVKF